MKVHYSEGAAIHTDPESCAGHCREAVREALTGGRAGEVLSGESNLVRGADAVVACRRQQARVRHREDLGHPASSLDPEHVRTSLVREPGDLRFALGKPSPGPDTLLQHQEGRHRLPTRAQDTEKANESQAPGDQGNTTTAQAYAD